MSLRDSSTDEELQDRPAAADLTGRRILVVEDSPVVAPFTVDLLGELGCEVVGPAPNMAAARELAEEGGYEAALNPMGEARDPRRDAAFALFTALLILIALYALLQFIVVGVLPDVAHSARPLADAARVLMGPAGAALISVGALISVYGYISANMLTGPRGTFALAERGDFPAWFAAIHHRFRTPHRSIALFALLLWGFSQFASFS